MHPSPLLDASPNAPQKGPPDTPNDDRRAQAPAAQTRRPRFALSLTTRIALVTAGLSTVLGAAIVVARCNRPTPICVTPCRRSRIPWSS